MAFTVLYGSLFRASLRDLQNHVLDLGHIQLPFSDGSVEGIDGLEFTPFENFCSHIVGELHLPVLKASAEQFLAVGGLLKFSFTQLLLDLCPGFAGYHNVQPVG